MNSLNGKVAVVLGASAEAGTGWGIAEGLAEAGVKVVVAARSEAPLKKLAAKIGGTAHVCDAAREDQIASLAKKALDTYGQLDFAINAAGLPVLGLVSDLTTQSWQSALDVNYLANVHFIREMAKAMGENGSIVLVTSLSTTHPVVPNVAYACAKAATDCLVRYAALEYGPKQIRINSVLPGGIISDLTKDLFSNAAVRQVFEKEVPLGRLALPRDIANAVLWLCGPAFVTGLNLPICGGNQLSRFPMISEMPQAEASWEGQGVTLYDQENTRDSA